MVAIRPPPGMQPEEWIRLCFTKSWWWRLLHPGQSKKIRVWISEFEAFLNTDEQRERFENEITSVITDLLIYGEAKLPDQKTYGRPPLAAAIKNIELMNEVKKIHREIAQTFIDADVRIHRGIIGPAPEKFTGFENQLKRINDDSHGN